jgi:hypothetical protein
LACDSSIIDMGIFEINLQAVEGTVLNEVILNMCLVI